MRINAGAFKGRNLFVPKGIDIRPTSDRARQAIFNILQHGKPAAIFEHQIPIGLNVLDIFCGTGALGLESLSRGAAHAAFIDCDLTSVRRNAAACNAENCGFYAFDALNPPVAPSGFDLIFIDPPYGKNLIPACLPEFLRQGWIKSSAVIVAESGKPESIALPGEFTLLLERAYGAAKIGFYALAG